MQTGMHDKQQGKTSGQFRIQRKYYRSANNTKDSKNDHLLHGNTQKRPNTAKNDTRNNRANTYRTKTLRNIQEGTQLGHRTKIKM